MHGIDTLSDVGVAVVAATASALLARLLRQPVILGYLLAGVVGGPVGLGLVHDRESIHLISELGLVLLLFIIGLEMELQKLMSAGRALVATGLLQFPLCAVLGTLGAQAAGHALGGGRFDAAYVGVAMALSSTMIVVKLLYDKHELMTLPGRLTLGVLVFQDVWAILVLAVQPTLAEPSLGILVGSLAKGALLVAVALALSRYALPGIFRTVARTPELLLGTALAWCFLVAGAASRLGLSREMGALVAGVALSTFPYNLDVIAKVANIRDFFVTLFFVALGMQIPVPASAALLVALEAAGVLLATRLLTVAPLLGAFGSGGRTSLLVAINLSQMSEFSLVIAALGLSLGHVGEETVASLTLVFALTSVASTYLIAYNHELQGGLLRLLGRRQPAEAAAAAESGPAARVVLLGFYREASSLLHQFELEAQGTGPEALLRGVLVIDFNPQVLEELKRRGLRGLYGDVASMETLHHASLQEAEVVVGTITDSVLKGTTNLKLLQQARRLCPRAQVVVTAETIEGARSLYAAGADFVFVPRLHSAHLMADVVRAALEGGLAELRQREQDALAARREVLA